MATQYNTDNVVTTKTHVGLCEQTTSSKRHVSNLIEPDSFAHGIANDTTLVTLALPVLGGETPESVSIVDGSAVIFSATRSSSNVLIKMLDNTTCIAGTYSLTIRAFYLDASEWLDLHVKLTAS